MTPEKEKISTTTDGQPPDPGTENLGAPKPINPETGQHKAYWVLSEDERKKGFVRPVRRSYTHVGPTNPQRLRDLTPEEKEQYSSYGYVKFEPYEGENRTILGKFWTQPELDRANKGCGVVTTMSTAIAETYARDPSYYGNTFCVQCRTHFPVAEFTWDDGSILGS